MEPRKWIRNFRYAYEGIQYALSSQRHMKFHFTVSVFVLLFAMLLRLSKLDILFILASITLVIVMEMINTAVEKTVDLAMPDRHPLAKIAKDVAAGAVLVTAVFAVAVGAIVFYEPVDTLLREWRMQHISLSAGMVVAFVALVLILIIAIQVRLSGKSGTAWRPSLIAAVSFAIATLICLVSGESLVILLSVLLCVIFVIVLVDKTDRSIVSLLLGGATGSLITLLCYSLFQAL